MGSEWNQCCRSKSCSAGLLAFTLARMSEQLQPKLSKWPFFLGDALLFGTAGFVYLVSSKSTTPLAPWQVVLIVLCVAGGAWLSILPFLLEYRVIAKLAEANALTTVSAQMQNLEALAAQIAGATSRWQTVQEGAEKIAAAGRGIAERMETEVKAFTEFMQKANDSERSNLRLEVEKMRRAESEWLQAIVRMLDHVFALHQGAVRSGQPNLIAQMSNFQNACRDAARRVGLVPFLAAPEEPFDAQRHQGLEEQGTPPVGSKVAETIATGYSFQGRLLRPALVRLMPNHASEGAGQELVAGSPAATQKSPPSES